MLLIESKRNIVNDLFNKENFYNVNIIFTGDFNAVSNSGVYKLVTEGKLNCTSIDYKKVYTFT
jgi:hypothetical protein